MKFDKLTLEQALALLLINQETPTPPRIRIGKALERRGLVVYDPDIRITEAGEKAAYAICGQIEEVFDTTKPRITKWRIQLLPTIREVMSI